MPYKRRLSKESRLLYFPHSYRSKSNMLKNPFDKFQADWLSMNNKAYNFTCLLYPG